MDELFDTLTLDWDNITRAEAKERLRYIKKYNIVDTAWILNSPTSGFHCYVFLKWPIHKEAHLIYRNIWKDDGMRVINDILLNRDSILFQKKHLKSGDWYETEF